MMTTNFEPARPSELVINTVTEEFWLYKNHKITMSLGEVIDNEMAATDIVEKWLNVLQRGCSK